MRGMHDLMQRRQQLLDRSFRAQQQGQQGRMGQRGQPGGDQQDATSEMGDAAGQQEGLRRMLGEMMRRLGDGSGELPSPRACRKGNARCDRGVQRRQPGEAIGLQTKRLINCNRRGANCPTDAGGWVAAIRTIARSELPTASRGTRSSATRSAGRRRTTARSPRRCQDPRPEHPAEGARDPRRAASPRWRAFPSEMELDYIERLLKRF